MDDLIIRGYILKYDLMNLINDFSYIKLDYGDAIKGRFDNRTNRGLIVFDIKNLKNNPYQLDYYYLIEIESKFIIFQCSHMWPQKIHLIFQYLLINI